MLRIARAISFLFLVMIAEQATGQEARFTLPKPGTEFVYRVSTSPERYIAYKVISAAGDLVTFDASLWEGPIGGARNIKREIRFRSGNQVANLMLAPDRKTMVGVECTLSAPAETLASLANNHAVTFERVCKNAQGETKWSVERKVLRMEAVDTAIGKVDAILYEEASVNSQTGQRSVWYRWFAPSVGMPVKAQLLSVYGDAPLSPPETLASVTGVTLPRATGPAAQPLPAAIRERARPQQVAATDGGTKAFRCLRDFAALGRGNKGMELVQSTFGDNDLWLAELWVVHPAKAALDPLHRSLESCFDASLLTKRSYVDSDGNKAVDWHEIDRTVVRYCKMAPQPIPVGGTNPKYKNQFVVAVTCRHGSELPKAS